MKFLLTTHHLSNWAGSEIVIMELAEEITRAGHGVDVFAAVFDDEFLKTWKLKGINFLEKISDIMDFRNYDVVYSQHGMLARLLAHQQKEAIFGAARPAYIYNHLSPTESFERPGALSEVIIADLILANSLETAESLKNYGHKFEKVEIMPNPSPQYFEKARKNRLSGAIKNLLVVSNHLPIEVSEAIELLSSSGVDVLHIGLPNNPKQIVYEDIRDSDAVLTIGKTVQYAFRAGCPIYIYDHFAGPGWLDAGKMQKAEKFNFSGRDAPTRKSAQVIADEISTVPLSAIDLVNLCPQRFHIEFWTNRIISLAEAPRNVISVELNNVIDINIILQLENNMFSHVDRVYSMFAEYRIAYSKCSLYVKNLTDEIQRLRAPNRTAP